MKIKYIFISHPYVSNPVKNRKQVDKICRYLSKKGYVPLSPLNMFDFMEGDNNRLEIMRVCYHLIQISDLVMVFGDSQGCKDEAVFAKKIGKPVKLMYENINYKRMMEENKDVTINV